MFDLITFTNKLFPYSICFVFRIEKIEVQYEGQPENATLYLNKNLSTPYNICQGYIFCYHSVVV